MACFDQAEDNVGQAPFPLQDAMETEPVPERPEPFYTGDNGGSSSCVLDPQEMFSQGGLGHHIVEFTVGGNERARFLDRGG